MGRPRDFDLDATLDTAVQLFWSRGYGATSVRDLCDAMGIRAGSFYAAFGSKEACFRRALERYLATQPLPREPSPDAIRAWFDAIVDPRRTPKGCLLVDSAVELPLLDPASQEAVRASLDALEAFFRRCLADRGSAARGDAALLAANVLAIHVLARAGTPPPRLRKLANQALSAAGLSRASRRGACIS